MPFDVTERESGRPQSARLVYIVGCGRSGTTILGFVLGNFARAIDLGEVLDFVKFRGQPNGFGPETENFRFWADLIPKIEKRLGHSLDFDRLMAIQGRVDTHWSLLAALFPTWRKGLRTEWRHFLRALYDSLLADPRFDVIVDSSKFPSRLWHLQALYPSERLRVIHLLRDPVAVAASRSTDEQTTPKSFISTLIYYLCVNAAASVLIRRRRSLESYRMSYEELMANPVREICAISERFELDPGEVVDLVSSGRPLRRGFIFNGNRMRTQESITLRRWRAPAEKVSVLKRAIGNALLFLFLPRGRRPRGRT